jgi:hypothetical protein
MLLLLLLLLVCGSGGSTVTLSDRGHHRSRLPQHEAACCVARDHKGAGSAGALQA